MAGDLARRLPGLLLALLRGLVYLLLALPSLVVVAASINPANYLAFPPRGFTLRWYEAALASKPFMSGLGVSTVLALLATLASLGLGTAAAYALDRHRFRGRALVQAFLLSPLVVPAVVLAIGLLQFLAWLRMSQSFLGLLVAHGVITLPYVVRTMGASFLLFDRRLEQAAMNLRATPFQVMHRVTLPILMPGLVSAAVFCFVTSFGNVTVSVFLAQGSAATLPVQIYAYVEHGSDPILAAVSTLVILVTVALVLVIERIAGLQRLV